jgi:integrase
MPKRIDIRPKWQSIATGLRRRGKTDTYQLRISTGQRGANGAYKIVERNITAPSVKAAKGELARLRLAIEAGDYTTPKPAPVVEVAETFGAFLDDWLEWFAEPARHAATTASTARSYAEVHIKPALGEMRLVDITAEHLDRLYSDLLAQGKASATVNKVHATIFGALRQAVRWGRIPFNPAANASPPPAVNKKVTPPAVEDALRLLAAAFQRDEAFGTLLHVALHLGCRRGEVCGLRWGDIDLEQGTVTIQRSVFRITGQTGVRLTTKTNKVRKVAIDSETVDLLRKYRAKCEAKANEGRALLTEASYLFSPRPDFSEPISPASMTTRFAVLRDGLGMSGFSLKDASRHLHATLLIGSGADVKTVSGRLGHASAAMTLDTYSAWLPGRDREAADAFTDLLRVSN